MLFYHLTFVNFFLAFSHLTGLAAKPPLMGQKQTTKVYSSCQRQSLLQVPAPVLVN
jgi:hypothetical protein